MKDINEYLDAKTVIIIVICIVVVINLFFCYRQLDSFRTMRDYTKEETQKNGTLQNEFYRIQKLHRENTESNLEEEMPVRMPPNPDESGLILSINSAFENTSGTMIDIQFNERLANENYIEMPFTVYLTTDYKTLVEILENLQNSERYIRLMGFSISAENENNYLSVVVDASAFSYIS